jgi:hypothetical protein
MKSLNKRKNRSEIKAQPIAINTIACAESKDFEPDDFLLNGLLLNQYRISTDF